MGRKPSLTKQIGEVLGTEDKREQLERIEKLSQASSVPPIAITVLYSTAGVTLNYVSPVTVGPADLKAILNMAVDEITKAVLQKDIQDSQIDPPEDSEDPKEVPQGE